MLSFEENKVADAVKTGDFAYVKKQFDMINTKHTSIIDQLHALNESQLLKKDELIEAYTQLLKEDRTELYPLYLAINHAHNNLSLLDSRFMQNLNILVKYYKKKQVTTNNRFLYESQIFNSINLDKIVEKYENLIDKDEKIRSHPSFKTYLDKLDITQCQNTTDKDTETTTKKIMRFCVFANVPSIYELGMIKTCIMKFKSMNSAKGSVDASRGVVDDKNKKIFSICQLYLYMSYPLCANSVLNTIANHYFS